MNRVLNLFLLCLFLVVLAVPDAMAQTTPTRQAGRISMTTSGSDVTFNWRRGDGDKVAVFIMAGSSWTAGTPANGTPYTANAAFGSGTALGAASCVYNGIGTSETVTGLTPGSQYTVYAFEYDENGGNPHYCTAQRLTNPATFTVPILGPNLIAEATDGQKTVKIGWDNNPDDDSNTIPDNAVVLQLSTDADFSTVVSGFSFLNIGNQDFWVFYDELQYGTTYHYRAAFITPGGVMSSWSVGTFNTAADAAPLITGITTDVVANNVGGDNVINLAFATAAETAVTEYTIDIQFDQVMDYSVKPTVAFNDGTDNPPTTLNINTDLSDWVYEDEDVFPFDDVFRVVFTMDDDTPEEFSNLIGVDVTGAQDLDNLQAFVAVTDRTDDALFYIDTEVPTVTPTLAVACLTGDASAVGGNGTLDDIDLNLRMVDNGYGTVTADDIVVVNSATLSNALSAPSVGTTHQADVDLTFNVTAVVVDGDLTGAYELNWTATDDAGNETTGTENYTIDNTPPAIDDQSLSVTQGCVAGAGTNQTISFTFDVADVTPGNCGTFDATNVTVTVKDNGDNAVNGGLDPSVKSLDGTTLTYTIDLDGNEVSGLGSIEVSADDLFTNGPTTHTFTDAFYIDNTAPVVSDPVFYSDVDFTTQLTATTRCTKENTTIYMEVTVTDAENCSSFLTNGTVAVTDLGATNDFQMISDGTYPKDNLDGSYTYRYSLVLADEAAGQVDVTITATDPAGNQATDDNSASDFTIDDVAPTITVEPAVAEAPCISDATDGTVTITISATDAVGCGSLGTDNIAIANAVDNPTDLFNILATDYTIAFADPEYTLTYTMDGNETTGSYTMDITITDDAGNPVTRQVTFNIDNSEPTINEIALFTYNGVDTYTKLTSTCINPGTYYLGIDATDVGCKGISEVQGEAFGATFSETLNGTFSATAFNHASQLGWRLYEIVIDGVADEGENTVGVKVADLGANIQTSFTDFTFNVDKTEPSVIGPNIVGTACFKNGSTMTLSVTATDGGTKCGTFNTSNLLVWIEQDGVSGVFDGQDIQITNVTGTGPSYTYTYDMTGNETGSIYVLATDDAGNTNTPAEGAGILLSTEYSVDNTAPTIVSITAADDCLTTSDDLSVEVVVTDNAVCDLANYQPVVTGGGTPVLTGGAPVEDPAGTFTFTYTVDLAAYTEGDFTFDFDVDDAAGNSAANAEAETFSIDETAPVIANVKLYTKPDADYVEVTDACIQPGTYYIGVEATDADCAGFTGTGVEIAPAAAVANHLYVTANGFDQAPAWVEKVGDIVYLSLVINANDASSSPTISIAALDGNENQSAATDFSIYVDNTAPTIANLAATPTCAVDAAGTTDVTITFDVTEASDCGFDASNITTASVTGGVLSSASISGTEVTYTVDLDGVADGDYTFTLQLTDDAGNLSDSDGGTGGAQTHTVNFSVDNEKPTVAGLGDIDEGCVKDGTALNFTFTVNDNEQCAALDASSVEVYLTNGVATINDTDNANLSVAYNAGTVTVDYTVDGSFADGPVGIEVVVTDAAGNTNDAATDASIFIVDNTAPVISAHVIKDDQGTPVTCLSAGTYTVELTVTETGCGINGVIGGAVGNMTTATSGVTAALTDDDSPIIAGPTGGVYTLEYTLVVQAGDATGTKTATFGLTDFAGNVTDIDSETGGAQPYTFDYTVDTDAPTISLLEVTQEDGCLTTGSTISGSVTVAQTGCSPISSVIVTIDGQGVDRNVTATLNEGTGKYDFTTTVLEADGDGSVDIYAVATDDLGQSSDPYDRYEVVVNEDYDLSIDQTGPENLTITRTDVLGDCLTSGQEVVITVTAEVAGCVDVDASSCTLNGLGTIDPGTPAYTPGATDTWVFTFNIPAGSEYTNDYSISATVNDGIHASETTDALDNLSFSVDNTKPTVTAVTVLDLANNEVDCITVGTYKIRVGVTDPGCSTLDGSFVEGTTNPSDGKLSIFLGVPNANVRNATVVSHENVNGSDVYVFDYTFDIHPLATNGSYHIYITATDLAGNASDTYSPSGTEFTVDPFGHSVATTTTSNAVGTCVGIGKVITATLVVDVDETSCSDVENVKAQLEFSDNSTVWMTPAVGNPAADIDGNYSDGTYEFTYTIQSNHPNGALASVTGYLNEGLNAEVTDDDEALALVIDTDAPTVTPNAAFALGCLGNGADAVFTDIVVDDNAVCSDIDETNIEVELYTAEGGTFRTLTSETAASIASTYTYDDQNNHFDFTYVIQGDEPQGEAIGVRLNVTDKAGNLVEDQVVDADAFSVDYEGPVVSNIEVSETCVKYVADPVTTLEVSFHVEEDGCGTFDASNVVVTADNDFGNAPVALDADINVVDLSQEQVPSSGYDVTATFTILATSPEALHNIRLIVADAEGNPATMAVDDLTGEVNQGDATIIDAVPTFKVDNTGPDFAVVNAPAAKIALYTENEGVYTLVTDACVTDGNYYLGVEPSDAGCDGIVGSSVVYTPDQAVAGQFYVSASTFANTLGTPVEVGDMYYIPLAIAEGDDGTESITLSLFDGLLNESDGLTYSIVVDNVGPVVSAIDIAEADQCVAYTEDGGQNPTTTVDVTFHVEEAGCGEFDAANVSATATDGTTTLNGSIDVQDGAQSGYDVTATFTILSNTTDGLYTVSLVIDDDKDNYATMDGAEPAATGTAVGATITAVDQFYVDNAGPVVSNIQLDKSCVKYTEGGAPIAPTTVVTATFHVEENGCGTFDAGNIDAVARTSWFGAFSFAGVVTDVDGDTPPTGYDVTVEFTVPSNALNGPYQVELTIVDDNNNAADFDGTEDPATGFIDGIIYSEATFTVDNDAPSITALTLSQEDAGACATTGATINGTVAVTQTGCSPIQTVTVHFNMPADGTDRSVTADLIVGDAENSDEDNDFIYEFETDIDLADGNGDVDVYATATDLLGTTSTDYGIGGVDFSLDQLKPTAVAIASGQDGGCYNHTQTITLTVSADIDVAGCKDQDDVTINFTGLGDLSPQILADPAQPTNVGTVWSWVYTIDIPENTTVPVANYDGLYTIAATVNDGNGAVASAGNISFTVDNTPATLTNLQITDACLNQAGTLEFSFLVTEEITSTDCNNGLNALSFTDPSTANDVQTNVINNNNGTWTVEATLLLSDVAQGDKQVTVNYTDDAGNPSTQLVVDFHVSTLAPTISAITVSDNCVNSLLPYSFTVADNSTCGDGINAAEYWIEPTGNPAAGDADGTMTISEGTFSGNITISGLANGQYDLIVVYTDDAGNSVEEDATFTVDKTAPEFALVNATDKIALYTFVDPNYVEVEDNCIQGGSYYLGVAPSDAGCDIVASDVVETTPVSGQFFMTSTTFANSIVTDDGVIEGAGDYAGMYFIPLTVANDEEGAKSVVLSIFDGAMNESTDLTYSITVDNNAPDITLGTVTACSNTEIAYSFTIDDTDCDNNGVNNATVSIWTTAIPAVQVGGNISVASSSSNETVNTYTGTLDVSGYTSGTYTLKVDYTDDSDNESDAASTTFNVDTDGPVVSTIALDKTCVKDGETVTMTFAVTDNDLCAAFAAGNISAAAQCTTTTIAGTNVSYDNQAGTASVDFAFPANPETAYTQGTYYITLTVDDAAGNTATMDDASGLVNGLYASIIDVDATFTLDNTGPAITFTNMNPLELDNCYQAAQTVAINFKVEDGSCGGVGATPVVTITLPTVPESTVNATNVTGTYPNYTATYLATPNDGTGTATVSVTAADGLGNSTTNASLTTFSIDNSAPVVSGFTLISADENPAPTCYKAGRTVKFGFAITDDGCATFDEEDIDLEFPQGLTSANFTNLGYNATSELYEFTYLVAPGNTNGNIPLTIYVLDSKGMSDELVVASAFSIDTQAPSLALENTPPTCVEPGDEVTFQVNASDLGCGVFNEDDITVTVTDGTPANISAVTGQTNVYEFKYTVAGTVANPVDVAPIINITASDDLGNTLLAPVTHALTVDTDPLTLAVNLPQTTCVSKITDGTFEFDVTATNDGCDTEVNGLTVTVTPTGGSATTVTESEGVYTYTLPTGPTYTGEATITVTATDGFDNTITETATFMIDNTAPVLSNYVDNEDCVGSPNLRAFGTEVSFSITAEDFGCSSFDATDIVVNMTNTGGILLNTPQLDAENTNGTTYAFTYLVHQNDPTGAVNITFDLTDSKGNIAAQYSPEGVEFSIDNTAPTLALSADKSCVMIGDQVTFTLVASDLGCATFGVNNIDASISGDANAQLSSITQAFDAQQQPISDTYTFTYTVNAEDSGILTVSVDAMDAVGNSATTETYDVTVDLNPLTLAVNLPQTTCVSQITDGTFVFDVTATNLGCDTEVNGLTVTVTPTGGNATTVTESEGVYTYTIPQGSTYTGEATITVTAVDGFNNTITETSTFMIDNAAPVLSAYNDDAECIKGVDLAAMGSIVHFSINVEDLGCSTFAHEDIVVNMTNSGGLLLNTPQIDVNNTNGSTYAYTYLVSAMDPTGAVNITFDLTDSKGNIAMQYAPAGDEFSIDNTKPALTWGSATPTNAIANDIVTITFDIADAGCSVTNQPVVTLTFADNSNTTATYASGSGNGTYTYSYTVPTNPVEGGVNVRVSSSDALGNTDVLDPANFEFVIISNTPADVTSIVVNDMMVEDADAGNNFTVAVTYSQPMDVNQNAPVVTFDPTVGGTFTNGSGAWSNGNQTYTMTYTIVDAGICVDNVDVSVTGGQNTVGIIANNGMEANLFNVYMCAAANARSDIQFAGNEANGISSLTNGVINTTADGTRVLKLTVRDDITVDTDTKPTNVTALTINAAGANQAAFNTHINAAGLFDGSGNKLADAVIGASTLSFTGLNVVCADDATYDLYLRITLANPLPAAADGKRVVFALGNTDVSTGANSTMMTTFTQTSSTAASDNVIQVVGTHLVYTDQPQNTSVGAVAPTVTVELRDVNGNVDLTQTGNITVEVTNTTTITTGGTEPLENGVATFDALQFGYAATGVALTSDASFAGVTGSVSSLFSVSAAMPGQVTNLVYLGRSKTSIAFTWTATSNALVIAQQGTSIDAGAVPQNGTSYPANNDFSLASTINGTNAKVVYMGSNATLTVGGLTQNTTYTFVVYAFNSDATFTPATITYNTAGAPTLTRTTSRFKDEIGADVELRSFDVTSADAQAFLDWETIRETDNVGFEVHRAEMTEAGLEPFEMITSYEDNSALAGLNESEFGKKYKLTDDDAALAIGATYVYRLVSVASDGYKQVQAERSVLINGAASMSVSEIQPNPVVTDLKFDLDMVESRKVTIQIYSLEGTLVAQPILDKEYGMGLHKVSIDLDRSMIPAGTYTLKVISGDNEAVSKRFVVVR